MTVNHSTNFVDPSTGAHTQATERPWIEAKSFLKKHAETKKLLLSNLDEHAWRVLHQDEAKTNTFTEAFLRDVKKYTLFKQQCFIHFFFCT